MKSRRLVFLLTLFIFALLTTQTIVARDERHETGVVSAEDVIWTSWDAQHYALVDDGVFLWIGTASGLVRYDKQSGSHLRLSTADGLPHQRFFCGAVDENGNLWFGGDSGLSRLDIVGEWTHFNTTNSGLAGYVVEEIAATAGGDIWTSHRQHNKVSRLLPDGSWMTYPNRETAVTLAYQAIKQTLNQNNLWTVAGNEVWSGYDVFDGAAWHDRTPVDAPAAPLMIAADSQDHVWALATTTVLEWDGQGWSSYDYQCEGCISGSLTNLVVDGNDVVWVSGVQNYPYSNGDAAVGRLPDVPGTFHLDSGLGNVRPPISDLLATTEGLWISGANWLIQPDGRLQRFEDVPFLRNVRQVIVDGHETTWVHSGYYDGVLQVLDDMGTATMSDDNGEIVFEPLAEAVTDIAPNGDLWLAGVQDYIRYQLGFGPRRYYQNKPLDYLPPLEYVFIRDIFAEDARHTWFVYDSFASDHSGIWRLDDGGSPADLSDDVWANYDIVYDGTHGIVAARDGNLWFGDQTGVYLYHDDGWEQLTKEPAAELIPAENGTLLVNVGGNVLVIEKDGTQTWRDAKHLVLNDYDLVRSTSRRNRLWRVTPNGAIWYWHKYPPLGRWDGQTLQTYESPVEDGFIEVDQNEHVWLVAETGPGSLLRMSPRPDFQLSTGPSSWFIRPGSSRDFAVMVVPSEGFANAVRLSISGLPTGITAELDPLEVVPGESTVVTLNTVGASLGKTLIHVNGISGDTTHTQTVTLAVVEQVHEMWLPVVPLRQ